MRQLLSSDKQQKWSLYHLKKDINAKGAYFRVKYE